MILKLTALSAIGILVGSLNGAFGQETTSSANLRAMNNLVLRHHELSRHASPQEIATIRAEAAADIEKRETTLGALIEADPDTALGLAFSADLLEDLKSAFPASANHFETAQTWRGMLRSAVEDNADLRSGKNVQWLSSGGRIYPVYLGSLAASQASGEVLVEGIQAAGRIAARALRPSALASATLASTSTGSGTTGAQKIVTILVNLPNYTLPSGVTQDYMNGVLFGNSYSTNQSSPNISLDDFWQQNSDGQASAPFASGQVVGPYLLSSNYNTDATGASYCDFVSMESAVISAAQSVVNFSNFNRVVIVMPNNGACTWAGVSGIGYWSGTSNTGTFNASFHWLRADTMTSRVTGVELASHEMGHGMGMNHARSRAYTSQALGAINSLGTITEYGDPFDTMASWDLGFYNALHQQEILGWLGSSNYAQVTTSGQYLLNAYETRNASSLLKALRIQRDAASNSWIWVEFRSNTGNYDSQIPSQAWNGALIHYEDSNTGIYSDLLDFTPSTTVFTDAALAAGQTWKDPYTNLSISVGAITSTGSGSALPITVSYGTATCSTASPSVSISPSTLTMNPNSSAGLTVSVKSNNSTVCPVATYNLTSTQQNGLSGSYTAASLTLAGGASGSVTLTETAGASTGTFKVTATATDASKSTNTASATANITVAAACTIANPTVTVAPASVSMNSGSSTGLTVTLKNNNSSACTAASFNLSATQPAGFTGAFSKVSLTGLASGATASATLTETAGPSAGNFTLSITGTNASSSTSKGIGTVAITVVSCTQTAPVVTLSPASISVRGGGSASFTVSVTNKNSSGCAATNFTLSSTQPSGFSGTLSSTSLAISPGGTGTAVLSETAGRTAGTYTLSVNAVNGSYSGTGKATVTVTGNGNGGGTTTKNGTIPGNPAL